MLLKYVRRKSGKTRGKSKSYVDLVTKKDDIKVEAVNKGPNVAEKLVT